MAEQESNIHRNSFDGGLNTDLSKAIINSNQYVDAQNVTLVNSGNFLILENLRGTLKVKDIISETNNTTVLGVFETKYKVGTAEGYRGFTIFTHTEDPSGSANKFRITAYVPQTDTTYKIYEETVDDSYLVNSGSLYSDTNERVIDGVLYPENGLDVLYFTDFYSRPRKLRCEIPASYAGTYFLTENDIDLLQVPALGTIELDSVNGITTGGSLLTGTYQLAYQLYNSNSNKYSGFSLLTNPIHIYAVPGFIYSAGIGLSSDRKITVDITPTENELAYYTHFRLAVVENIGTMDTPTNVGLTNLEVIANVSNYEIKSNKQYSTETLDNIVIDLAAIERVKTMTIRENRLLLGNVINQELTYDNGTPTISTAPGDSSIIVATTSGTPVNSAENELFMSTKRGHFRDEVYRYAISYFDDDGYYSYPKTLDLSGVDFNRISSGIDLKYPAREYYSGGTYFTVFNSNDKLRHLGLRLTSITNHPSWSRGFVILRAKRKKNILFQTPIVPMVKLSGLGAVGKYPTEYRSGSALTTTTDTTLSPMGPSSVFVPYNMFYGSPSASPGLYTGSSGGVGIQKYETGEAQPLQYQSSAEFVMIFPPENIYQNSAYQFTGSEQFKTVDAVVCETNLKRFDSVTLGNPGTKTETSISGTFHATIDINHYFNDGHTKVVSSLRSATVPFRNVVPFDNYDDGKLAFGSNIMDYTKLMTSGIDFGVAPSNQRCAIADFNSTIIETAIAPPSFAANQLSVKGNTTSTIGSYPRTLGTLDGFLMATQGTWEVPATTNLGMWNIGTNTPAVADGIGTDGDYYMVIGAAPGGTAFDFDGGGSRVAVTLFNGDSIRYSDGKWYTSRDRTVNPYSFRSNVIEISNVIANLDDSRYGNENDYNEYIFTGTKVVFTNAEISGGRPAKTVEVWGGDCTVSAHTFKVSDSTYTIVNNNKFFGAASSLATLGGQWEKVWLDASNSSGLTMPVFFKNAAQYLTVILESEYNGTVVDHSDSDIVGAQSTSYIDLIGAPTETKARYSRPYLYNINLNKENDQKIWVPKDALIDTITKYKSRVYYSDIKIYQTDIEGFNTVRVNNIYDLPETYGALTKLAVSGDRLYSLQQQGISIIPVGERVIETTDTSQLAVRSGEFLGTALYIDTLRGCQHLGTVVNSGRSLYFADGINKAICSIDGGSVQILSGNGLSTACRTIFSSPIIDRELVGAYDATRDQYWVVKKTGSDRFAYVWNEGLKKWESNVIFPSGGFGGAVSIDNKFMIIGKDTTTNYTSAHQMHAGNYSQFMGTYSQPSVTFVANPNPDVIKVYDALLVNSNAPLSTLNGNVKTTKAGVLQSAVTTAFDTQRGEGNYKVKIGRDTFGPVDGATFFTNRLRGPHATIQLLWGYDLTSVRTTPVNISSVLTKFRPSANLF